MILHIHPDHDTNLGRGYENRTVKDDLLTLETAYKLGFRYFDTSRAYGSSEFVTGEFVPGVPRESIFLATKFHVPAVHVPTNKQPRQAAEQVKGCLFKSLERLKKDYLDLYQVHDSTLELVLVEGGILEVLLEAKQLGCIGEKKHEKMYGQVAMQDNGGSWPVHIDRMQLTIGR